VGIPGKLGKDLQAEHERYLVEVHYRKPVIITDYPRDIKAFYMKQNDDGKTVKAMDVLFPGIGVKLSVVPSVRRFMKNFFPVLMS